jgi:hypothetical protein
MFLQKIVFIPSLYKIEVANITFSLLLLLTAEFWIWIQDSTNGCVFHYSIGKKDKYIDLAGTGKERSLV